MKINIKNKIKFIQNKLPYPSKRFFVIVILVISIVLFMNRDTVLDFLEADPVVTYVDEEYKVTKGDIRVSFPQEGTVLIHKYELSFKSSGVLSELNVVLGDEVTKDQILAKLDSRSAQYQLAQSQSSYSKSASDLEKALGPEFESRKLSIDQASQAYIIEKENYEAGLKILKNNIKYQTENEQLEYEKDMLSEEDKVTDANYNYEIIEEENDGTSEPQDIREDQAEDNLDYTVEVSDYNNEIAENNYDLYMDNLQHEEQIDLNTLEDKLLAAEISLKSAELQLQTQEISIDQARANLNLNSLSISSSNLQVEDTILKSPIEGIVYAINYHEGESVGGNSVIEVINTKVKYFQVYLEDIEIYQISKGMKVVMEFENLSEEYVGEVVFISPAATIDSSGWNSYEVLISIDSDEEKIMDELVGDIEFISKEVNDAIKIPNEYVFRENGKSQTKVVDENGETIQKELKLGFSDGDYVEVLDGLIEGDTLIMTKMIEE